MTIRTLNTARRPGMARARDRAGFPHVGECGNGSTFGTTAWRDRRSAVQPMLQPDASGCTAFAAGDAMN